MITSHPRKSISKWASNAGFDVLFDVCLINLLNNSSNCRWFETPLSTFEVTLLRQDKIHCSHPNFKSISFICDNVMTLKFFLPCWPFVRGIYSFYVIVPVTSGFSGKGQIMRKHREMLVPYLWCTANHVGVTTDFNTCIHSWLFILAIN